jgi:hypothetical protein
MPPYMKPCVSNAKRLGALWPRISGERALAEDHSAVLIAGAIEHDPAFRVAIGSTCAYSNVQ